MVLLGSEKQVAWATTIRDNVLNHVEVVLRLAVGEDVPGLSPWDHHRYMLEARLVGDDISWNPDILAVYMDALKLRNSAHWWIERRGYSVVNLLADLQDAFIMRAQTADEDHLEAQVQAEATVLPEKPTTRLVAEIRTLAYAVEVVYPERWETFRELMHKLKFTWAGLCWRRDMTTQTGEARDRAAEVGHRLLNAGIPIRIYSDEVREMAVSGAYKPEPTRWVYRVDGGPYAGWFRLTWPKGEDWYETAKRLHKSRYHKPDVVVPPESMDDLLDFAEMHGFSLSSSARKLVTETQITRERSLTTRVALKDRTTKFPDMPRKLSVPEEVTVADELRDDL